MPFETIKIPQFWHIGDLFRPFRLAAMTIFPEKGRISEMAIFAFVDFTKFLKIIKLTFFENFKQFLGSSPISICSLRGPGWFFTKNLDHPIFPSEIAWMPSYIVLEFLYPTSISSYKLPVLKKSVNQSRRRLTPAPLLSH